MPGINNSFLVQASNFVQSNDLVYRTALDVTGWDVPFVLSSRNKDERRENIIYAGLVTILGFAIIPLEVFGLNKIFAGYLNKNDAFFNLRWEHLDHGKHKEAIKHLEKTLGRTRERLEKPSWFDKFVKKGIIKNIFKLESAIKVIKENPSILKEVYKFKKYILLADLLLSSTALALVPPIKVLTTKYLFHKDRFTGTENYLSDKDLNKLVKKDKNDFIKRIITAGLCIAPFVLALLTHKITRAKLEKGLKPNNMLIKIRDGMDYTNGIYLTLGGMFAIFQTINLNAINWTRDKYERAETIVKLGLCVPSFWFGDYIFNGNIAKLADKILSKNGKFENGTFINLKRSNIFGAHPREIKEIIEHVEKTMGKNKASISGKIATGIFISGFIVHSLAMACILALANSMTKNWVKRDLSTINND